MGYIRNRLLALREHKAAAHLAFDSLWKDGHFKTRTAAYRWLASKLDIPMHQCHMSLFDEPLCRRVVDLSVEFVTSVKQDDSADAWGD